MPSYDYECADCGGFSLFRPMTEYKLAQKCPICDSVAPRSINGAPTVRSSSSGPGRTVTDRGAFNIQTMRQGLQHWNCRCCSGRSVSLVPRSARGTETKP
jgi:putative FmdB family regulatory protein